MSKYAELFNYLRECPQLNDLWSIGATEDVGVNVIIPQGASQKRQHIDNIDVTGDYNCTIEPYPSYYEDYQLNCYRVFDANDSSAPEVNINVLSIDDVQSIIDWIEQQDELENLPQITGEQVISIECNPSIPQIRYVNEDESSICYFITIRIRYVNKARRRFFEAVI